MYYPDVVSEAGLCASVIPLLDVLSTGPSVSPIIGQSQDVITWVTCFLLPYHFSLCDVAVPVLTCPFTFPLTSLSMHVHSVLCFSRVYIPFVSFLPTKLHKVLFQRCLLIKFLLPDTCNAKGSVCVFPQ